MLNFNAIRGIPHSSFFSQETPYSRFSPSQFQDSALVDEIKNMYWGNRNWFQRSPYAKASYPYANDWAGQTARSYRDWESRFRRDSLLNAQNFLKQYNTWKRQQTTNQQSSSDLTGISNTTSTPDNSSYNYQSPLISLLGQGTVSSPRNMWFNAIGSWQGQRAF